MKILELFGGRIRNGGEEAFVFGVLKELGLPQAQVDCLVVEDCKNDVYRAQIEESGGKIYELKLALHATKFHDHVYRPVLRFLKEHPYDIVHIHASSIAALAVLAAAADRAKVKKVIVHAHATGTGGKWQHLLVQTLSSCSMRRHADVFCACSKAAAAWKFSPKLASRAVIVKNGIDTARFAYQPSVRETARDNLNIPADALVIGHVGRFSAEKNHRFLLCVFAAVQKKRPDAKLLLLGDGEGKPEIEQAAEKLPAGSVIFTGNVPNVPDYMQAMDVFVLPSSFEGFGIVAIEAQAAGLPCVVSDGVPREVKVTDAVDFLPIDAGENAWAKAILQAANTPRADGSAAVREAGFDRAATVAQVREIYANA